VLTAGGSTWSDYDGGGGTTIRFGNGVFAALPTPGLTFGVTYRVGGGAAGNVPADTITTIVPGAVPAPVSACTNPFPATGGADAETPPQIRDRAPVQFSTDLLRVVRIPDYVAAAQSMPWVQQAGTSFRWTGSWLTVLTAANPSATEQPTLDEVNKLTDLLNRRRLAGYESYVLPPRYVSVDLQITLCANAAAFGSDVQPGDLLLFDGGSQARSVLASVLTIADAIATVPFPNAPTTTTPPIVVTQSKLTIASDDPLTVEAALTVPGVAAVRQLSVTWTSAAPRPLDLIFLRQLDEAADPGEGAYFALPPANLTILGVQSSG